MALFRPLSRFHGGGGGGAWPPLPPPLPTPLITCHSIPSSVNFLEVSSDNDFLPSQSDLGVAINSRFNWGAQCKALVSKANSRLGLLKRTCHFTTDKRQKRSFYLALIRYIFEHCSVIWSPQTATNLEQFVAIQKRAIKWINGEPYSRYNDDKLAREQNK